MLLRQVEDAAELDANPLVFLVAMVVATATAAACMVMGVSVVMMVVMATATRMLVASARAGPPVGAAGEKVVSVSL